MNSRANLEQ